MGHPLAEVYEDIEQELEELGQPQFEDKLEAPQPEPIRPAWMRSAPRCFARLAPRDVAVAGDPRDDFTALVHLIRKAGDEWPEGVVDGAIGELHE